MPMPPKKSVFRQPGAQHFQLVHRSQRDPLYHDAESSKHVLKPFERENIKKGRNRADLENDLNPSELAHDLERTNIGEASLYGVYYDDTDYNYMQHLKPVGVQEDGVDSILLPATTKTKIKVKGKEPITLKDLPPEALPSTHELPRTYESQEAIPSSIAGFRPDLDPHLRQTLDALEDDAFVDDHLDDDFFGELVAGGERGDDAEDLEYEFDELGLSGVEVEIEEADGWEARFAQFKKAQNFASNKMNADVNSTVDNESEGGDTVGALPQLSVIGGKRRRKGTSDASGYSMSSSSMFRNAGLTTLDERFDQIERQYASNNEDEGLDDEDSGGDINDDEAPELITTREDFDSMMDEFLDKFEILGRKMKPVLEGESGVDKLNTLRRAMAEAGPIRVLEGSGPTDDDILMPIDVDDVKDRWDCETILSTYSNLDNHPRLIRARDKEPIPKIRLDPRTGLPSVLPGANANANAAVVKKLRLSQSDDDGSEDDESLHSVRITISRPRNESLEDKKARKQAAKADRQARRVQKKATKEQFTAEVKQQKRTIAQKEASHLRKL